MTQLPRTPLTVIAGPAEEVVRSPPDGYTLLFITAANAINTTLYEKLSFNLSRDIVPVAGLIRAPSVLEVNPSVPAMSVPDFIAYAKANPGKLTMASSGIGTPSHVFGELFKFMTGVNLVHVPYRGAAPAVTDLLAGQVQVFFDPIPNSIGYIRAGKLRPLAITSATRSEALPECADCQRVCAGLRGDRLVRHRRTEGHAGPRSSTSSTRRSTRLSTTLR
jgi:tripartite-type tricarboxylate transporter receptor subunit TctC